MFRDNVANNGQNHRAGDAAEGPGQGACGDQQRVAWRQGAQERAGGKAQEQPQQGVLAVKAVQAKSRHDPGNSRRNGVGGDDQVELGRSQAHEPHVLGAQRQDDEEIQVRGELDGRQQQQQRSFALRIHCSKAQVRSPAATPRLQWARPGMLQLRTLEGSTESPPREKGCLCPGGTPGNSPALQRWVCERIDPSPGGTAEAGYSPTCLRRSSGTQPADAGVPTPKRWAILDRKGT